jgi:thiamine-monophosphate kinase
MKFNESDILRHLVQTAASEGTFIVEGVAAQDDGAVLRIPPGFDICATTDFVRGTGFHLFREGYLSLEDVGYYVVAANVSDLAAMGAKPFCYLSVVRYKSERTFSDISSILLGISNACSEFSCPLVGGDTGSYEADVLSGTALGLVKSGQQLSRHTLRPNSAIFVSGDVGRPAAALAAVSNNIANSRRAEFERALEKWRRPRPRIELGLALVDSGMPISCMDISDGLTASLQQLNRISGYGFEIDSSKIPIDPSVLAIASEIGDDPIHLACSASVDFELLFSAPLNSVELVLEIGMRTGVPISHIGHSTENVDVRMRKPNGEFFDTFPGVPWDHQVGDVTTVFRRDPRP